MSTWLINDQSPEYWGVTVAQWEMRSGRASSLQLACIQNFDASEKFAYGSSVTIKRDGVKWFVGKVRAIPKSGSASSEGHDYLVEDAWAELERLTYQEPWGVKQTDGAYYVYSPTVVLGMNSAGTRINVGQQIAEVLAFAVAQGINITAGTMPTGMTLWPSEVVGQSCAAIIRDCLKYYPDWIPWIDPTTSTPTFRVTPRASATALTVAVTDCTDLRVTKTQDRVPDGVRICYVTANVITDGEPAVYRSMVIDQFPTVSLAVAKLAAGPGILVTTVELAGMQVHIQKQQVQTRDLPTTSSGAKAYLKLKFPVIKDIADAKINISEWTTLVIDEDETEADAVDSKMPRTPGGTRSDLPRELVKGTITEWMRKKVGRVLVEMKVQAGSGASEAEKKKIESLPPHFSVIATNAVTKIYKGVSSFTAGESAPAGIAQAYYNNLVNGCYFEGSMTLTSEDLPAANFHGKKINISGSSISEWSSMGAPVHSVSCDLKSGQMVVSFGPNPDYSIQDFLEFLKLLNKREHTEYTVSERTGNEFGDDAGISAKGDSVGPYDTPETITGGGSGGGAISQPFELVASGTAGDNILKVRESTLAGEVPSGFTAGFKEFTISDSAGVIYAKLTINSTTGAVTARAVEKASSMPSSSSTIFYEQIGSYTVTGSGGAAVISAINARYGPIPATICRNWYAAAAPYFGVTFL